MNENLIEIIGIVSGIMAIIGIPGILDLLKWRKKISTLQHSNKEEFQHEFQSKNQAASQSYDKDSEKLRLYKPPKIVQEFIKIEDLRIILVLGLPILGFFLVGLRAVKNAPSWSELFSGEEIETDYSIVYYVLFLIVCFFLFMFYQWLQEQKIENRYKYYSFLYDKIYTDGKTQLGLKWGFLNEKNKEVLPCIFDKIEHFNGYFKVQLNRKVGILNKDGKVVLPVKYSKILEFDQANEFVDVSLDGEKFRISQYGKRSL